MKTTKLLLSLLTLFTLTSAARAEFEGEDTFFSESADPTYLPDFNHRLTDVGSIDRVNDIYANLRSDIYRDPNRSLCSLRANIWSYQMEKSDHVESGKIFLIYTWGNGNSTYGSTGERWWFHTAPYIVADGKEYVMEKFGKISRPMLLEDWEKAHTNGRICKTISMKNDRSTILKLNVAQSIPFSGTPCYVRKTPKSYGVPLDFYLHDIKNANYGTNLSAEVIRFSCREVFDASGRRKKCGKIIENPSVTF
jgi:hypothetical protein